MFHVWQKMYENLSLLEEFLARKHFNTTSCNQINQWMNIVYCMLNIVFRSVPDSFFIAKSSIIVVENLGLAPSYSLCLAQKQKGNQAVALPDIFNLVASGGYQVDCKVIAWFPALSTSSFLTLSLKPQNPISLLKLVHSLYISQAAVRCKQIERKCSEWD